MNVRKCLPVCIVLLVSLMSAAAAEEDSIGALGRIMPESGIISITSASYEKITSIAVREGDTVSKGDVILELEDSVAAKHDVEMARIGLAEIKELGAKAIDMQKLKIAAAEHDYEFAQRRYERFKDVGGDSISLQQMEERQYQLQKADLARTMETKELDRLTAEQNYRKERAEKELQAAELRLRQSTVFAPIDGTVLELFKHVGEPAGGPPVARIADLSALLVIGEVYEGDVLKLAEGMRATISSNSLSESLEGRIESIGRIISGESKIATVRIRLEDSGEASKFINMETNIVIHLK